MSKPIKLEFVETEIEVLDESLDEKSGDSSLRVQVKWQQADVININHRSYPEAILQGEINRIQEKVTAGKVTGSAYHPTGRDAETVDVSHKWDKVWMEEDGSCLGECTIIPTSNGKEVMTLIKNGVNPALSTRGCGTTTRKSKTIDGKKVPFDEVNKDFKLVSPGDFVLSPSVPDAGIRAILESAQTKVDSEITNEVEIMNFDEKKKELENEFPTEWKTSQEAAVEKITNDVTKKLEKEHKKVVDALEAKFADFEEKFKVFGEATTRLKEAVNDLDAVANPVEEDTEDPKPAEEAKSKDDEIAKLTARVEAMEAEKEVAKKAEKDAKEAEELQKDLKVAVETELGKDEYKSYKSLLETELLSEDTVEIESVEKVTDVVKSAFIKLQNTLAEAKKAGIIKADIEQIGEIKSPEGGSESELSEKEKTDKMNAAFAYAKKTGSPMTKKEFVESYVEEKK